MSSFLRIPLIDAAKIQLFSLPATFLAFFSIDGTSSPTSDVLVGARLPPRRQSGGERLPAVYRLVLYPLERLSAGWGSSFKFFSLFSCFFEKTTKFVGSKNKKMMAGKNIYFAVSPNKTAVLFGILGNMFKHTHTHTHTVAATPSPLYIYAHETTAFFASRQEKPFFVFAPKPSRHSSHSGSLRHKILFQKNSFHSFNS